MTPLTPAALAERARDAVACCHHAGVARTLSGKPIAKIQDHACRDCILAAFTTLAEEARREQRKEDQLAVCWMCLEGWPFASEESDQHVIPPDMRPEPSVFYDGCIAAALRAQASRG